MRTADRPRILEPGLWQPQPGTERYRVIGGGATAVHMEAGDRLEVIDPQGRQVCELVAFGADGVSDPGLLGGQSAGAAEATLEILSAPLVDVRRVRAGLERRAITLEGARSIQVFEQDSPAGVSATFDAAADCAVVVAAPGAAMDPAEGNPATDLVLYIHRHTVVATPEALLPAPLADASQDFTVDRRTAVAYQVNKGDFIQVLDIEGRECSDFQCFAVVDLDRGKEDVLDPTITRTLMGSAYPGPGLYSKFYNSQMQPLLEVIQDTVGRHDTFNTACNARYYDEMGFPGHVNCTDNINEVWAPYGVDARRGWEAVNFFYNTNLDAKNQIFFDEPWSRPGDYVLMRALDDLVCVTTACPCDIDAANGWDPTDIQVRVYDHTNMFKKA
ncbi:MAG: DUF1989 domain-containing protein, partial [Acidimicrobiales bacterium]